MAKQCICGRSEKYPICDGSHNKSIKSNEQIIRDSIGEILFDLGKEIQVLRIDKDNTILDIPYKAYIDKLFDVFKQYNQ